MSSYVKDLIDRVVTTFAFTFLGVFTLADLSTAKGAAIAGFAAAASVVKGALGARLGREDDAGITK